MSPNVHRLRHAPEPEVEPALTSVFALEDLVVGTGLRFVGSTAKQPVERWRITGILHAGLARWKRTAGIAAREPGDRVELADEDGGTIARRAAYLASAACWALEEGTP